MSQVISHLNILEEKRNRQKLYADNIANIPACLAICAVY